jgi:CRP-like cAMP-binding protein
MDVIPQHNLFKLLTPEDMKLLVSKSERISLKKNATILAEGKHNDGFYIILNGLVKVYRRQGDQLFIIGLAERFDFIGLDSAIYETTNNTTCISAQDCTLLFIPREVVRTILTHSPALCVKLMGHLSHRVNELETRIYDLNHKKVLNHLAELIYNLSPNSNKTVIVPNILTITEMAHLIGTTKYYVYKLIQKLEDKKAVTFSDRKLRITNKELLRLLIGKKHQSAC